MCGMHTKNPADSQWGFHLTVYTGFPLRLRCPSIVGNGETDLSLMGRCPASSQTKARHLSPLTRVISHVTAQPGNIQRDSEGKSVQSQETEEHEGQKCRESD